jgi:hypothetical protein
MSLMGMTFARGLVPAPEIIEKGQLLSPLFAGPVQAGGPQAPSRSLESFRVGLKDRMPLPSMMLGYTGENGTDLATVLRCIMDGARAGQTPIGAPVWFVQTDDTARSAPREWQYAGTQAEMALRRGVAVVHTNRPAAETGLLGVMTGAASVTPAEFGTFAPGAMAEHLTSWSAEFQKPQAKCTEWLKAGATVTAGMVTEPYNHWAKFPHARFFVHYTAGCTALESFYQSILSPVQVLLLGDPLSRVMTLPVEIKTIGLSKEIRESVDNAFVAEAKTPLPVPVLYSALLDGRQIKEPSRTTVIELPMEGLADGYHEVRIIAQAELPVTPGGFRDVPFNVNRRGRSVAITALRGAADGRVVVSVASGGAEPPQELAVLWNGREVDRRPYAGAPELSFDERLVGQGPSRVQAVAIYADGMRVLSAPHPFTVAFMPKGAE